MPNNYNPGPRRAIRGESTKYFNRMIDAAQLRSALSGLHIRASMRNQADRALLLHMAVCAKLIKRWRIERHICATTLAAEAKITKGTISRIEHRSAAFSPKILVHIIEAAIRITRSAGN